jgi:RNA polymerase sigma factor (sigma-70 family)
MNEVIHFLRSTLLPDGADLTDGQLLERFVSHREPAVLEALMRRHGSMVWGVCRRILQNHHDAEDAFQATFLVLVRKAASIVPREMAGNWLYGVAHQTALKSRGTRGRRKLREAQVTKMPEPAVAEQDAWSDLHLVLDQELSRLPEKYRTVIVLCDLEGKTSKEAALQLSLPQGTVASRLARARVMLAKWLARHGLTASGGTLAAVLSEKSASASVPSSVLNSTIKTVTSVAAGQTATTGLVSARVAALTEGVMKGMLLTRLKTAAALVLVFAITGLGVSRVVLQTRAAEPPKEQKANEKPHTPATRFDEQPVPQDKPKPPVEAAPKLGADRSRPIRSLLGHQDRVNSVAYSPDGRYIATAGSDSTARLWDVKTGDEVRRLEVAQAWFPRILFSPDNEFIVATVVAPNVNDAVIVWNRRTGEKVRQFPGFSFAFSPDGQLIACGGPDRDDGGWIRGIIRLYDFATSKMLRELSGHLTQVISLAFSPDGKTLVSVGLRLQGLSTGEPGEAETRFTRVWDVATGKENRTVLQERESFRRIFSPDGRTLGSLQGSGGDAITLWEAATFGRRAGLTGHTNGVWGIAFSPDGRTLASSGGDGSVRLWHLPSGKEIGRLEGHKGCVSAVTFSPDGRTLVSGGLDKTALLWDVSRVTGRRDKPAERTSSELEADWRDLAGDAAVGYAALARLVSSPERAVAFLGKQLESTNLPDGNRMERLVVDLNDKRFPVREKASKELEALAEFAAPALRKTLAGKPSSEVRQRLTAALDRLDDARPSPELVRQIRGVEALECIGNPEARRLLDKLAAGPTETRLMQEAKAAAERLAKRAGVAP